MPLLTAGTCTREIDAVVLDKDGTLIDFEKAWGGRLRRGIDVVGRVRNGGPGLRDALFAALGADPATGALHPDGPYVSGTIADCCTIAAGVLYGCGMPWHTARATADTAFRPHLVSPPRREELVPIGDVTGQVSRLRSAGMRLAVITNDERDGTLSALAALGIAPSIDIVSCADDLGITPKPAPDGLLAIARALGLAPSRLAMVGDSAGDLHAGRAAGCGLVVGVLSGPARSSDLAPHADAVVADIHALRVGER